MATDGGKAGVGPLDKDRWAPDGNCHPESCERSVFMLAPVRPGRKRAEQDGWSCGGRAALPR